MKTDDGIKVIEYNTRFGDPETEVLLEAMESDLIEVIQHTQQKRPYPIMWKEGTTLGVCLASLGYPSHYEKGKPILIGKDIPFYSMALHKEGETYTNNGGRVIFVVGRGQDLQQAHTACYSQVASIKSENLYSRSDIGLTT